MSKTKESKVQAKPGDKVLIKTEDSEIHGLFMNEKNKIIVIKLSSGYNQGIEKSKIKSIKVLEPKKESKIVKKPIKQNISFPKISILHTGGTIASKVDYETGGVIAKFSPEELIAMFPEIAEYANINSRLISNMFSDDMRFAHYNILAKEIEIEIKNGAEAIIVTHGTDTLHYTSAALSFMLKNVNIPVILVGAQRSSDRPSSDAAYNTISAVYFSVKTDWHGIGICMHENESDDYCVILPGLKTRKMHSSRRDAFKPVNSNIIAKVNFKHKKIELKEKKEIVKDKLEVTYFNEKLRIGFVKSHPNLFSEEIFCYKDFDGLVLEGTGLGHFPVTKIDDKTTENEKILLAIKQVSKKIPAVITSQTIYGRVNLNVYANGRKLKESGVLGDLTDMTPETAFIKLAWLLSNHKDKIKEIYSENLKGEISERIENRFDLF